MAKNAKDFYAELEKASHQSKKSRDIVSGVNNDAYVKKMSQKPFPIGKIIILLAGIIFAIMSNFSKIASSPVYIQKIRPLPIVEKIYQAVEVNDQEINNEVMIKHGEENNIEMVQIRGRYYPKSADDTYVIDGETVFYKDQNAKNRKK